MKWWNRSDEAGKYDLLSSGKGVIKWRNAHDEVVEYRR